MSTSTMTKTAVKPVTKQVKVLRALRKRGLTAKQIGARFSVGNPTAMVSRIKATGVNIKRFKSTDTKGRVMTKYRVAR